MKTIRAWITDYRPFIVGGDCHQPMACKVEASGPFALGKGIRGYLIVSPSGKTFVVEEKSGGIVGPTLEQVKADVKKASKKMTSQQIKKGTEDGKGARMVQPAEFWARLKAS